MSGSGAVKMSELARRSGVPASTIKHYGRVGLLPPPLRRPNKQMAWYDEGLVDRIKAIKILQTERFLPLETIARLLGEPPRPGERRAEALRAQQLLLLEPAVTAPTTRALTRAQVLAELVELTERDLDELTARGLLRPVNGVFGDADLDILQVIHETRAAGMGEVFPMEILEPYVGAVRELVRLEIDLFRHRLGAVGTRPPATMAAMATMATRLGERLIVALRRKLVVSELRKLGAEPDANTK